MRHIGSGGQRNVGADDSVPESGAERGERQSIAVLPGFAFKTAADHVGDADVFHAEVGDGERGEESGRHGSEPAQTAAFETCADQ